MGKTRKCRVRENGAFSFPQAQLSWSLEKAMDWPLTLTTQPCTSKLSDNSVFRPNG